MALVTTQSKPFIQLVQLQQDSLDALQKIRDAVTQSAEQQTADTQSLQLDQLKKLLDVQSQTFDLIKKQSQGLQLDQLKQILSVQKDSYGLSKKSSDNLNKQMGDLAKGMKSWKTVGDKMGDLRRTLSDTFSPDALKKKLFGAFNVGGMFTKKIEDLNYIQRQKALGTTRTGKELRQDAKDRREAARGAMNADEQISKLKRTGMSEKEIRATDKGKALYDSRDQNLQKYSQLNIGLGTVTKMKGGGAEKTPPMVQLPSDKGQVSQSTTDMLAEQQQQKENQLENLRLMQTQTDLLQQIAANTALSADNSSAGGSEDKGGGPQGAGGLAKSLGAVANSFGGIGKAVGYGLGAAIGGIFQGIMEGIANGIKAFASAKVAGGVLVLGMLTGVVYGLSQALQSFQDLDWETIGKGLASLAAIGVIGGLAGTFAGPIALGAAALAAMGGAVWVIGEAMDTMGNGLQSFVDGLERLSNVDADKLSGVADAIKSLGWAMAGFAIGETAAGLSNLVTNFLSFGQDTPVEQLIKIGTVGPGVEQAANGLNKLSDTMAKFASIDSDSMDAVKAFPWDKATKFVAAGGAMSVQGAKVYNQSKAVEDDKALVDARLGKQPTVAPVNTAIQNNTTNNNVVKPSVRNIESSQAKYLASRY